LNDTDIAAMLDVFEQFQRGDDDVFDKVFVVTAALRVDQFLDFCLQHRVDLWFLDSGTVQGRLFRLQIFHFSQYSFQGGQNPSHSEPVSNRAGEDLWKNEIPGHGGLKGS
jgi:hypothetical protein